MGKTEWTQYVVYLGVNEYVYMYVCVRAHTYTYTLTHPNTHTVRRKGKETNPKWSCDDELEGRK